MWRPGWVVGLGFVFGVAGWIQHWQKAKAAMPLPCPQFQCKNVTYYWDGNAKIIKAIFAPGGANLTVSGLADLFTTSSTFQPPNNGTGNKFDLYSFPACNPICGKDGNGVWQVWQEVAPAGNSALVQQGAAQFSCVAVKGGGIGPTDNPPTNNNPNKNSPPGYTPPGG